MHNSYAGLGASRPRSFVEPPAPVAGDPGWFVLYVTAGILVCVSGDFNVIECLVIEALTIYSVRRTLYRV